MAVLEDTSVENKLCRIVGSYVSAGQQFDRHCSIRDDLGLVELELVELQLDLEEDFGLTIPDQDWATLITGTVGGLVSYIEKGVAK